MINDATVGINCCLIGDGSFSLFLSFSSGRRLRTRRRQCGRTDEANWRRESYIDARENRRKCSEVRRERLTYCMFRKFDSWILSRSSARGHCIERSLSGLMILRATWYARIRDHVFLFSRFIPFFLFFIYFSCFWTNFYLFYLFVEKPLRYTIIIQKQVTDPEKKFLFRISIIESLNKYNKLFFSIEISFYRILGIWIFWNFLELKISRLMMLQTLKCVLKGSSNVKSIGLSYRFIWRTLFFGCVKWKIIVQISICFTIYF